MEIKLVVTAEVSFVSGKFAGHDEIVEAIKDEIQDPGQISVNEGEYNVDSFEVDEEPIPSRKAIRAAQKLAARRIVLVSQAIGVLEGTFGDKRANAQLAALVTGLREAFDIPGPGVKPE